MMDETEFRDLLFREHRETLFDLINIDVQQPVQIKGEMLKIAELLKSRTENMLNSRIERLQELILDGKEIRLAREGDSTTRVDLLGHLEEDGDLVIIELKKSYQTERQAFNELLAYANHFCTLFPFLTESSFTSMLIAPMEGRGVRDAFAQELIINEKNIIALQPEFTGDGVLLSPYYPSDLHYRWIENHLLSDEGFIVITASFALIDGWIDSGPADASEPPQYSKDAFHTITRVVAQKAEKLRLSGFVYARQRWKEIGQLFPNQNTIVLCLFDPFSLVEADVEEGQVFGRAPESRKNDLQSLIDQIQDADAWLYGLSSSFLGQGIRVIQEVFEELFGQKNGVTQSLEIELPHWRYFKENAIEAVFCHNMAINTFGLVQVLVGEYFQRCYGTGFDEIHYADDLPKFPYQVKNDFLAVWKIISGISQMEESED